MRSWWCLVERAWALGQLEDPRLATRNTQQGCLYLRKHLSESQKWTQSDSENSWSQCPLPPGLLPHSAVQNGHSSPSVPWAGGQAGPGPASLPQPHPCCPPRHTQKLALLLPPGEPRACQAKPPHPSHAPAGTLPCLSRLRHLRLQLLQSLSGSR